MRTAITGLAMTGILTLLSPSLLPAAEAPQEKAPMPASSWVLNDQGYFERPGLSVLVFHDDYPEGKQGGIEIIQHGERVAALGDVRLESAPGQWGKLPVPGKRLVDRAANRAEIPLRFEKEQVDYTVRVEPDGDAIVVTVDLARPLPAGFVGKAGFNMELFPTAYFGKAYHLGGTDGVFTRQGNGPNLMDGQGLRPAVLAKGSRFVAAPEDPMCRLVIESLTGDLLYFDGRSQDTNGWFLVRSLVPAGATKGAVRWRITPNAVPGWMRPPSSGSRKSATIPDRTSAPSSSSMPARTYWEKPRSSGWTRKRGPSPCSRSRWPDGGGSSATITPSLTLRRSKSPAAIWSATGTPARRPSSSRRRSIAMTSGSRRWRPSCLSKCVISA